MPLITTSYFIGEINIPNAGTGGPVDKLVDRMINLHEVEFLRRALGESLFRAFRTGLGGQADGSYDKVESGVAQDPADQKWKDLLNGKEYTGEDGLNYNWNGLVPVLDGVATKESPIAAYVYFHFMKNAATQTTSIGEAAGKIENAEMASPRMKMAAAWNRMHGQIKELNRFLKSNATVYTEWTVVDGLKTLDQLGYMNPFF